MNSDSRPRGRFEDLIEDVLELNENEHGFISDVVPRMTLSDWPRQSLRPYSSANGHDRVQLRLMLVE